ncbi:hypothetical protein MGLY_07170 [Neomoorella glycerini]|uniref:Uncharacterized protein n=1 Tax=Neomoorella glycerini TaxID=55779 RepID=A0A6I5ZP49_9FIRM|nr:hypothetical protein [Moorella glycerini]QGP91385.1 hypothetical protein MGLY_07170 [Moorella glycerini]
MKNVIFSTTGCIRCKIVKDFMNERGIPFVDKNIKEEGREDFQQFYTANRRAIYRGPDGIEFPVFTDGVEIRQGIGSVLAYLQGGKKLDGFVSIGALHKEWVDGLHVSSGNPEYTEDFIAVLMYLKGRGMKLKLDTNGKNSHVLRQILDYGLADFVVMEVVGPLGLYKRILGAEIDLNDVEKTISIVPQFPKYQFQTTIVPVIRQDRVPPIISYMTPEEIAETAKLIEEVTGSKKHPYFIRLFQPKEAQDERFRQMEPISPNMLFTYRTAARAYQVFTEIEKH